MTQAPDTGRTALGPATLCALVVANMIGAGVFTTSGFALSDLGSPWLVLLAWLIGGGVALCGAASYGALIRLRPESGGEYLFLARGIHPLAGFIGGWISLLAGFTGAIAYAAITFVAYATPALVGTTAGRQTATALILVAALLHGIRLEAGTRAQNLGVLVKLVAITAFVLFAFLFGDVGNWPGLTGSGAAAARPGIATFALTLMWISFSYSGFNAAVYLAGEVPDGPPHRAASAAGRHGVDDGRLPRAERDLRAGCAARIGRKPGRRRGPCGRGHRGRPAGTRRARADRPCAGHVRNPQ